jgi:predicted phage tail protein
MDAANDYNRETITIYADTYDTDAEEKTAQATFDGITSYEQAYREGMYQLYSNLYLRRTISFEANIDAIACTVGDVILVAHDVPKWAKSGRIHRVDGNTLLLPVELDSAEGDYRIQYRTINDNIYTSAVTILKNEDGWCKVQLASINEADPPQEQDIFDLAQATVGAKPFVVKSISRAQDFTRTIECIEYDERIYNEEYNIPEPQYSSEGAMIKNVSGLSAMKYQYMAADGTIHYRLDISWERESLGTYQIFTSNDNVNWDMLVSIDGTQYTGDVPEDTAYVKVVTVNSIMRSPGVSMTITNMISMIAGLEIADLTATVSGTSVKLTWREITNTNLQYYRILVDDSAEYRVLNATFELSGLTTGRHVIDVTAVNKAGISGIAATTTITIP